MKASGVLVLVCIAAMSTTSKADGKCDRIGNYGWSIGTKTCFMDSTAIDSKDFSITSDRDESVKGFYAKDNKQLEYLPNNIGAKFPSLLGLTAKSCSIKEVTKDNFKGLGKLQHLLLYNNQIEKIDDDTFEYIPAVEQISLGNNKIKKLNGRAFASLHKLTKVYLNHNECINEGFDTATRIAEMRRVVTGKCGFTKSEPSPTINVRFGAETEDCGVPKKATPTIMTGESFGRGNFPWMVALYRRLQRKRPGYICGGSVISDRHVLTAAHCLEDRLERLLPRDITALFGAYDLDDHLEDGRFSKSPSRMFVHDHWNPRTDQFDADIAMLLMPENFVFSTSVQPICLWDSVEALAASTGIISGWGQSQNKSRDHETIPTMLHLPIHTNEDCFLKFPHLAGISSKKTFCAGSADGRGPCKGDSGGGFYVSVGSVFYLKGIVSAAWDVNEHGECLLKMFTLYTDVVQYKDWIDGTMQRD